LVSESKLYVGDCEMLVETESKSKILDGIDKDLDVIAINESSVANGLCISGGFDGGLCFGGSGCGNDKFIEGLVGVIFIKEDFDEILNLDGFILFKIGSVDELGGFDGDLCFGGIK